MPNDDPQAADPRVRALIEAARVEARAEEEDRTAARGSESAGRPSALPHADSIPGYEIIREIHRGGQGVVYEAVQKATSRRVAVKILREGLFADERDLARFEREAQVLGQLQHPSIVTIHDSGCVGGLRYLVMDYVRGEPLDASMEGRERSVRETMDLFGKVCAAVNAAHLKGIIHRDLKPGNILVDESGNPRVLDFGLAKLAGWDVAPPGGGGPVMTITGQFVGSLPWASPEQVEGRPERIDLRTDVYSLGVILYQMLTGRFPYDVEGPMPEVMERIRASAPARPSTVRRRLDADAETIALKCLAKEPDRRYQSAGELSRDVERFLKGEAIEARPASMVYRTRKFVQRHQLMVATGVGVLLLYTVAFVLILGSLREAERQRDAAAANAAKASRAVLRSEAASLESQRARAEAEDSLAFLRRMLAGVDPRLARGRDTTLLREMLDLASTEIDARAPASPRIEARARLTIGQTYHLIGSLDDAEQNLRLALGCLQSGVSQTPGERSEALRLLGSVLVERGRRGDHAEALALLTEAIELKRAGGADADGALADALFSLATTQRETGDPAGAHASACEALEVYQGTHGPIHPVVGLIRIELGLESELLGHLADAEEAYRGARTVLRRSVAAPDPALAAGAENLGGFLVRRNRREEGLPLLREAFDQYRHLGMTERISYARTAQLLGLALQETGDHAGAVPFFEEAVRVFKARIGVEQTVFAGAAGSLAESLRASNRIGDARAILTEAIAALRGVNPAPASEIRYCSIMLLRVIRDLGDSQGAESICLELLSGLNEASTPDRPAIADLRVQLGQVYMMRGEAPSAEREFRACLEIRRAILAPEDYRIPNTESLLGQSLAAQEKYEEAEPMLVGAYQRLIDLRADHDRVHLARQRVIAMYEAWNKPEQAESYRNSGVR